MSEIENMPLTEEATNVATFAELLQEDLDSEMADNEKYQKLAQRAEREYPGRPYGKQLRDMATEEEHHKKHLADIMNDIRQHERCIE